MKKLSLTFVFLTGIPFLSAVNSSYGQTALPQLPIGKREPVVQITKALPAADSTGGTAIRLYCGPPPVFREQPLYVVDGQPITEERMKTLEPNQIEKIVILKDSEATAVYGPSGLNGVVLITTKK